MSVIIKGMDMPKKGVYYAVISFDGDSLSIRIPPSKKPFFYGRIKEIPTPHGRLIDADDLDNITVISYPSKGDPFVAGRLKKIIAPTIIEAEESE